MKTHTNEFIHKHYQHLLENLQLEAGVQFPFPPAWISPYSNVMAIDVQWWVYCAWLFRMCMRIVLPICVLACSLYAFLESPIFGLCMSAFLIVIFLHIIVAYCIGNQIYIQNTQLGLPKTIVFKKLLKLWKSQVCLCMCV